MRTPKNHRTGKSLYDGGYITFEDSTPKYHFYVQDHLGNNRLVVSQTGAVEQQAQYYPSGAIMTSISEGISQQPYLYSGKELDRMHALDWYDFGARHYDAALLRWHSIDPLCEKYYHISPYVFCANNFINAVDKDGREVHPSDSTAYHALLSTIAPEDKQYVILNAKGNIDYTTMKSHYSESKNYNSLIELAADELLFNIYVQTTYSYKDNEGALRNGTLTYFEADEYFADRDFSSPAGLTTGETGRYGISLLPGQGISKVNSTTKDVHIYIHPSLSPIGKAEALSHELYGHGYLYMQYRDRGISGHDFRGSAYEHNTLLRKAIKRARMETVSYFK